MSDDQARARDLTVAGMHTMTPGMRRAYAKRLGCEAGADRSARVYGRKGAG